MLMTSLSLCPLMCKDKHGGIQSRNAGTLDSCVWFCGAFGGLLACLFVLLKSEFRRDVFWGTCSIFKKILYLLTF